MTALNFNYAESMLIQLLSDLANRRFTPMEFWRQTSRIVKGATGLDSAEELQAELSKTQDQLSMMSDAANRLLGNLKWVVGNATCACDGVHTCGLDDQLSQIDRIERQMQAAQGGPIVCTMH